tara:strand:+ start:260 stop:1162 length:903 start_codon:yes stop_codon:yes gene_type:complete
MKTRIKISLILFSINSVFNIGSLNSENLKESYGNQISASWEKAQFERIYNNTSNGVTYLNRYFIDKNKNIYHFTKSVIYNSGPIKIGNLNEKKRTTGNTCLIGTNYQCLANITVTTTQYSVEDENLFKFSKIKYNDGSEGDVDRTFLGGPISVISQQKLNENKKKYSKVLIDEANDYLNRENYKIAIDKLNRAIDLDPQSYEAYFSRGIGNYMTLKLTDAYEDYSKSLQIKPHRGTYQFRAFALIKILNSSNEEFRNKNNSKYMRNACSDFKESYKLGMKKSGELFKSNNCSQYGINIDS